MENSLAEAKSMRLLTMYGRLMDGRIIKKKDLSAEFGITQRSVQRDLESLRVFFAEEMMGREIVYDSRERPLREFCVSDFRQNQEYHVINVQDEGLFPLSTFLPEGWDGMRAGTA